MSNIIEQIPSWDSKTFRLYVIMIIVSTVAAKLYSLQKNKPYRQLWIIISFLMVWIVIGFSTCGADYGAYQNIFENSNSLSYWNITRIEKGYLFLNLIIRFFTSDFRIFHAIWALLFIGLIYLTIIKWEDNIDISLAVLCFTAIYCLQSMSLMRMYLAMAITVWGFRFYYDNRQLKYLICIVVACSIHLSAICLMMPLILCYLMRSQRGVFFKVVVAALSLGAIYVLRNFLFAGSLLSMHYTVRSTPSFGIATIVYHVPIAILLVYCYKSNVDAGDHNRVILIFALCSLVFGMAGYMVDILGRVFVYFAPLYMLFPASVLANNKGKLRLKGGHCYFGKTHAIRLMVIVFIIFRAFMMTEYFYSDKIMPYTSLLDF